MYYLNIYGIFCLVIAFIMAALFKQKFEKGLITGFCGIIVILYLCYILNVLDSGFVVVCVLLGLVTIYSICMVIKKRNFIDTFKLVCCPTTIIYFLFLIMLWMTVRENKVSLIDELHLWAALPKILSINGGELQQEGSMLIGYWDYIPGMSIWQYFIIKLCHQFSEALLYFSYAALGGAMLLPMFEKLISFKKYYLIPVASMILYAVPLMFYNSIYNDCVIYYKSIHVDAILGITLAYTLWLFLKKSWNTNFEIIQFVLGLSVLVLMKSTGMLFVSILLISLLVYSLIFEKRLIQTKKYFFFLFPVALWIIWEIYLRMCSTTRFAAYSATDVLDLSYVRTFLNVLFTKDIMQPRIQALTPYCSYMGICFLLLILMEVLWFLTKEHIQDRKIERWVFITLVVEVFVFVVGLYGLCVGPFQSNLLSYARYICTTLITFLVYFTYQLMDKVDIICKSIMLKKTSSIILILGLGVLCLVYPLYRPQAIMYPRVALQDADKMEQLVVNMIGKSGVDFSKVTVIVDNEYDTFSPDLHIYLQRRLYFNLLDNGIRVNGKLYLKDELVWEEGSEGIIECCLTKNQAWEECQYVIYVDYVEDSNKIVTVYETKVADENTLRLEKKAMGVIN